MAESSSKSPIPTFSGENFPDWSTKMKEHLISEGLWRCVDEGCKKPNQREEMSVIEMEEFKQETVNDKRALSLINQSLSTFIFIRVFEAPTAKEAWDTLHSIFQPATEMNVEAHESKEEISEDSVESCDPYDGRDGVMPLSGDKPFFDMVLTKSALKPLCHLNFPTTENSKLPSTNILAKVRFFGKIYDVYFYGKRKQKGFGAGWRQLLDEHNMKEGDFLIFEVLESSDTKLEINMQILKNTIPPDLQEEIRRRENKPKLIINIDDDDE